MKFWVITVWCFWCALFALCAMVLSGRDNNVEIPMEQPVEMPAEATPIEDIWAWDEHQIKQKLSEAYSMNSRYIGGHSRFTSGVVALQTEVIILQTLLEVKYSQDMIDAWSLITEEAVESNDNEWQ